MRSIKIFLVLVGLFFGQIGFADELDDSQPMEYTKAPAAAYDDAGEAISGFSLSDLGTASAVTGECLKEGGFADKVCPSSSSPYLQGSVVLINALLVGAKQMGGVNAACSKYAEALKIASGAMSAYNAGCGYAQMACESSCIRATSALKAELGVIASTAAAAPAVAKIRTEQVNKALVVVGKKKGSCDTYKAQLAVGATGLVSMIVSAKTAAKCDDGTKTQDQICKENPAQPECQINCSLEKYASNIKCICEKNPYTTGCTQNTNTTTTTKTRTNSNVSNKEKEGPASLGGDPNISYGAYPDSPSSDSGGGAAGGIAAGGAGGSAKGGGADAAESKKRSGFNPNILSGESGGGGRFGGGGGGGYDSDSGDGSGKYRSYMPGGANDPNRNVAGQGTAASEVTGGGGKSNFQKVRETYTIIKPKMLGSGE